MYIPQPFREERSDVLIHAVSAIKLATLVTSHSEGLQVSHIPMQLAVEPDGKWTLSGHVARGNPHWRLALPEHQTVAIFQGPQAYISPSWYATKQETGMVVPTWNYIAVHAHGVLTAIEDVEWLRDQVQTLTDTSEAERAIPWSVDDAPEQFIDGMLRAIVGVRLDVDRMEGAWKMAQQKPESDRLGAINGLDKEKEGAAVANVMRKLESNR